MPRENNNDDELPEHRSDRSIPLNVETVLVEGARKKKHFTPGDEGEKLKDDDSDIETIRGDMQPDDTARDRKSS